MNFLDFPVNTRSMIRKEIGQDFTIKPLKKWTVRVRKLYQQKKYKTPNPFLIYTNNSKKFKALVGPSYLNDQFENIINIQEKLKYLDISPKIVCKGPGFILAEYLNGSFPEISDNEFISKLAQTFANIHNIETSKLDTSDLKNKALSIVDEFIYDQNDKKKIINLIEYELPKYIWKGYTYADHNVKNYLWFNKNLKLIDFGSFQKDVPLDFNLSGSALFNSLDEKKFWNDYLGAGGLESVYNNKKISKVLGLLFAISYNFQRYKDVLFIDFRLKNARKTNVLNQIKTLTSICND